MSRIRANKITNKLGTGAVEIEKGAHLPIGMGITGAGGVNITGVVTATSFSGNGANLTGIDATSVKDSGGNIKIQANSSGAVHSGVSTFNNIKLDDNKKVEIGSSQDLQLYHNATASYIDNNTGALYLRNNVDDDDGGNIIIEAKSGKASIVAQDDEGVSDESNNTDSLENIAKTDSVDLSDWGEKPLSQCTYLFIWALASIASFALFVIFF